MKRFLFLLIFILNGLFITGAGNRYYAKVNSKEEAEIIAKDHNLDLESYSEGIAVLLGEYNIMTLNNSYSAKASTTIYEDSYCLPVDMPTYLNAAPEDNMYWILNYYAFNDINWMTAYCNGITGRGVTVAVLDTGCMINHPDLAGAVVGTYNAIDDSNNVTDNDGHGTHVAGIIAARDNDIGICGIAPDSSLYIMKVESDNGYMYYSNIVRALNKCAEDPNISVINMSFYGGSSNSPLLKEAIQNCLNKGKICVMAAGNTSSHPNKAPACFGLGLIAAYHYNDSKTLGSISNYGGTVNILAPGSIWSTYNNGSYAQLEGTSMATPIVSATAALIYSRYSISKDLNGSNTVKNLIINNKNSNTYTFKDRQDSGGLDIGKALSLENVEQPSNPIIGVMEIERTRQAKITMCSNKTKCDIYYTLDGTSPSAKNGILYTGPVYIDSPGYYIIKAIAVNQNRYSYVSDRTFSVSSKVISNEQIKSVEIYINKKPKKINKVAAGSTIKLKIKNKGKNIPVKKFKWKSSNKKIATVKNGVVSINKNAKKGKKVKIKATLGGITKSITLKIE